MSKNTIGKTALVAAMAQRLGFTRANCEVMVEETLVEIERALRSGRGVTLPGFGAFKLRRRAARAGHVAGREYQADARAVVRFRPAAELAEAVAALPVPAE